MIATKLKTKAKAKAPTETRRLGYARASTYGQKIDAQLAQLRAEGCTRIYREKMGGVRPDRRELLKLLKALAPGNVVILKLLDRLHPPPSDRCAILKQSGNTCGEFRSLAGPRADTATRTGRLMIEVLDGLASVERD